MVIHIHLEEALTRSQYVGGLINMMLIKKIGNSTLQKLNQTLRETRMPFNSCRTADKGHFHWKWGSEENNEWFWFLNNKVI